MAAGKREEREETDSTYGYETQAPPYGQSIRDDSPRRSLFDQQSQYGGSGFNPVHQQQQSLYGSQLGFQEQEHGRSGSSSYSNSPRAMSPSPRRGGLPEDGQILADVQAILATADLSTLTKKGVRQELESAYGCELGSRRALVNQEISRLLGL